eukprot:6174465-Pleurochrysis_carterae.AAC.1
MQRVSSLDQEKSKQVTKRDLTSGPHESGFKRTSGRNALRTTSTAHSRLHAHFACIEAAESYNSSHAYLAEDPA